MAAKLGIKSLGKYLYMQHFLIISIGVSLKLETTGVELLRGDLKLVSKELNHCGVIAGLFR